MKRIFILMVLVFSQFSYCQELAENRVDDFTKDVVKRTSWEKFAWTSDFRSYARISKINETSVLGIKFFARSFTTIDKGADIMLMLEDGQVITLKNSKYEICCIGCGSIGMYMSNTYGLDISAILSDSDKSAIASSKIKKIRIYCNDGYEESEVKTKQSDTLQKLIALL